MVCCLWGLSFLDCLMNNSIYQNYICILLAIHPTFLECKFLYVRVLVKILILQMAKKIVCQSDKRGVLVFVCVCAGLIDWLKKVDW